MGPSVRALLVSGCMLSLVVAVGAQGRGGPPQPPENIQVLPDTWSRQQVSQLMSTFNESLGVQCSHCHTEDPDAPPPNPGQNPRLDYALDDKPEKGIARRMIQMTMDLNFTDMRGMGDEAVLEKMSCFTCHRGEATPVKTPEEGWARGSFTLTEEGPEVPQRGRGAGRGAPGGAPAGAGGGGN
jgi:hypothetical protein